MSITVSMSDWLQDFSLREQFRKTLRIEYRRQAVLGDVIVPVLYELPMEDCAQASSRGRTRRKACISLNAVEDGLPYAVLEIIYK